MPCTEYNSATCDAGHKRSWKCSDGRSKSCPKCEREAKLVRENQKQEIEARNRREIEEREHLTRLDAINARIAKELQAREEARLKEQRSQAIKQKENDLSALIASPIPSAPPLPAPVVQSSSLSALQQMLPSPSKFFSMLSRSTVGSSSNNSSPAKAETTSQLPPGSAPPKPFPKLAESPSKKEWSRQKNVEGASNPSVDAIMDMTGLEEVKKKVLNIKTKIDISIRQNASLKQERFNAVLLGNPGTGGCSRFDI